MGMNNLDTQIDRGFDEALTNAGTALTAVRGALQGAGSDSWTAFNQVFTRATSLPQIGAVVGAQIREVIDNKAATDDYRRQMTKELRDAGTKALDAQMQDLVQVDLPALEARLGEASLPIASSADAGDQVLRRQEVDGLVSGVNDAGLMGRMIDLLGQNLEWDRVLCSDYGRVLLIKAGQGNEWAAFRKAAVFKLLGSDLGSERQLANRRALRALRDGEVRGRLSAFHLAGQRAIPPALDERRRG